MPTNRSFRGFLLCLPMVLFLAVLASPAKADTLELFVGADTFSANSFSFDTAHDKFTVNIPVQAGSPDLMKDVSEGTHLATVDLDILDGTGAVTEIIDLKDVIVSNLQIMGAGSVPNENVVFTYRQIDEVMVPPTGTSATPEPSSMMLLGCGVLGLAAVSSRKLLSA